MSIHLILFIWFIVLAIFFNNKDSKKYRSTYSILCIFMLMFFSVCRNIDYGAEGIDTARYCNLFKNISDYSWREIWNQFLVGFLTDNEGYDLGYLFFQKAISYLTASWHLFTLIAQLFFYIPCYLFLKKYAHDINELLFAFVFYVVLVYVHANTGSRQFYAMGFGILFFIFCGEKKYKWAFISLLLGMTLHRSLLAVTLPFLMNFLSPRKLRNVHLFTFCMFPVVLVSTGNIIMFLGSLAGKEQYAGYGFGVSGGATNFIFMLEALSLICYFGIKKNMLETDQKLKQMYTMVPCFTFLGPLIYANGSMIRLSMYMYFYLTILFPIALKGLSAQNSKILLYLSLCILILLTILTSGGGNAYHFFWNVDPIDTW